MLGPRTFDIAFRDRFLVRTVAILASFVLVQCGARSDVLRPDVSTDGSIDGTAASANPHAVNLAVGARHACAVLSDGTVRCWGANARGQLGDGTTTNRSTPVSVTMPGRVARLAAGGNHTCALLVDGAVFCWGANEAGQLGDGTTTDSSVPRLALEGNATAISLGLRHSLALRRDGTVIGFGSNERCQLNDHGAASGPPRPLDVFATRPAIEQIAAGSDSTCAILDGGAWCTGALRPTPPTSCGLRDAVLTSPALADIAIGSSHLCVRTRDGLVGCVGLNGLGQLGDGTTVDRTQYWRGEQSVVPHATAIACGASHSCAIDGNGGVWCWGNNAGRQLGIVGSQYSRTPVRVALGVGATSIALGEAFSCAIGSDDVVRCWGTDDVGQLGDGTMVTRADARAVEF